MSEATETVSQDTVQQQDLLPSSSLQEHIMFEAAEIASQKTQEHDTVTEVTTDIASDSDLLPDSSLDEDPKSEAAEISSQNTKQQQDTSMNIIPDAMLFSGIRRNTLSVSIFIGGAPNPRRDMVGWDTLETSGWINRFILNVSRASPPGTHPPMQQINIGEAFNPHRSMASFGNVNSNGWTQRLSFFAWPTGHPGTVIVAVARAPNPWRCKFEVGRRIGAHQGDEGWTEFLVFWVPSNSVRVVRRTF